VVRTPEELRSLLDYLKQKELTFDIEEELYGFVETPREFRGLFESVASKSMIELVYEENDKIVPMYINATPWLSTIAQWRLQMKKE
jgi:hypothetical protein